MRIGDRCYQTLPCQHQIKFDDGGETVMSAHLCYFLMIANCMQNDPNFAHFEEQIGLIGRTITKIILFPCVIYNFLKIE